MDLLWVIVALALAIAGTIMAFLSRTAGLLAYAALCIGAGLIIFTCYSASKLL